jgi:hypothetical protein
MVWEMRRKKLRNKEKKFPIIRKQIFKKEIK